MTFQVELVSPEGIAYSGEAEMVVARTVDGGDIAFSGEPPSRLRMLALRWCVNSGLYLYFLFSSLGQRDIICNFLLLVHLTITT